MTMTLSSTIIPKTKIRAASVTVFNSIPVTNISPIQIAVQTGRPVAAMRAVRNGKNISMTAITTRIEMMMSRKNDTTESFTTFGWSVIRWNRISGGSMAAA